MLNLRKKAEYTYSDSAQLLSQITRDLDRVSANYTIDGVEAVVNFQVGGIPQQYHIRITPMEDIKSRQEAAGERGDYSWGPEGLPPGITNASKLNMKKTALEQEPSNCLSIEWNANPDTIISLTSALEDLYPYIDAGGPGGPWAKGSWYKPTGNVYYTFQFSTENEAKNAIGKIQEIVEQHKTELREIYVHSPEGTLGDTFSYEGGHWVLISKQAQQPQEQSPEIEVSGEGLFTQPPGSQSMKERLPLPGEKFDLPENLPPGIANKLNMKKSAQEETWGEMFNLQDHAFKVWYVLARSPEDIEHSGVDVLSLDEGGPFTSLDKDTWTGAQPINKVDILLQNEGLGQDAHDAGLGEVYGETYFGDLNSAQQSFSKGQNILKNHPHLQYTLSLDKLSPNYQRISVKEDPFESLGNFTNSSAFSPSPERLPLPGEEFDLPENLPPGIAVRLNMKKNALEIGGVEFPDTLKFKEEITSPLDVETDVQKLYKDAESFVINYIWSGLREHGIIEPDDANVIQTDVDKVQFSSASSLVNQLMQEGWFAYLELSYDTKLRTNPQLQQQIFNTIQNEIKEGAV